MGRGQGGDEPGQAGVAFAMVREFGFDDALIRVDARRQYGEIREIALGKIALGMIRETLHQLVLTRRFQPIRVISLRRAGRQERARYNQWLDECERFDE